MRYPTPSLTVLVAATLALATPTVAQAQFGGLLKKVEAKVAHQPANSGDAPHFDAVTVELTPTQLDGVIRGIKASVNALNGTNGNSAVALAQRVRADIAEVDSLERMHPGEREQYENSTRMVNSCRSDVFDKLQEQKTLQMDAKVMADPSFRAKYVQGAQEMQAAAARGDTSAVRVIQARMMNTLMPVTHADTAAANKQCGVAPAPPGFIAREKTLNNERDKWEQQIRDLQVKADTIAVQGSGLTRPQFATARERIQLFLGRAKVASAQRGFSAQELTALREKETELRDLLAQYYASAR